MIKYLVDARCLQCGSAFQARKDFIAKRDHGKFCSVPCMNAHRRQRPKPTMAELFCARTLRGEGCWEWLGTKDQNGYGSVTVPRSHRRVKAHRLSWELHNGTIPDGLFVCHHCDNPSCVNPAHLFIGTAADNSRDMASKGRAQSGERHFAKRTPEKIIRGEDRPGSKLTEAAVRDIRVRLKAGESQSSVGRAFGVSRATISDIALRRTWGHVL